MPGIALATRDLPSPGGPIRSILWPPAAAMAMIVLFGAIDGIFLASNSLKIHEGGWFPLVVGGIIASIMLSWREGASLVRHRLQEMSMPLKEFVATIDDKVVFTVEAFEEMDSTLDQPAAAARPVAQTAGN